MSDLLRSILEHKAREVAADRVALPMSELAARAAVASPPRGFAAAIESRIAQAVPAVIAEIKRASPSRGVIRGTSGTGSGNGFDPSAIARSYAAAGAACLSVLTDVAFFQGADAHLQQARAACTLPVLRKDFVIDSYQVLQARALGADCILLIVAALADAALSELATLAMQLGMDVLVEAHDRAELERALRLGPDNGIRVSGPALLIGINNRDLRTFQVSLETTLSLCDTIPRGRRLVTESGIGAPEDVARMRAAGIHAFLVGEALLRAPDPGAALQQLFFGLSMPG